MLYVSKTIDFFKDVVESEILGVFKSSPTVAFFTLSAKEFSRFCLESVPSERELVSSSRDFTVQCLKPDIRLIDCCKNSAIDRDSDRVQYIAIHSDEHLMCRMAFSYNFHPDAIKTFKKCECSRIYKRRMLIEEDSSLVNNGSIINFYAELTSLMAAIQINAQMHRDIHEELLVSRRSRNLYFDFYYDDKVVVYFEVPLRFFVLGVCAFIFHDKQIETKIATEYWFNRVEIDAIKVYEQLEGTKHNFPPIQRINHKPEFINEVPCVKMKFQNFYNLERYVNKLKSSWFHREIVIEDVSKDRRSATVLIKMPFAYFLIEEYENSVDSFCSQHMRKGNSI